MSNQSENENKVITTYRIMDNGIPWPNREIWATEKFEDMSIADIMELLNNCEISYVMNATDEETFVKQLDERESYITFHDLYYGFNVANQFRDYVVYEIEYDYDYQSSDWGNDVDGIVMYIGRREIFRSDYGNKKINFFA